MLVEMAKRSALHRVKWISKRKTDYDLSKRPQQYARMVTIGHRISVHLSTIPHTGLGLFADCNFKKGQWITGYDGELIGHREYKIRKGYSDKIMALSPMFEYADGNDVQPYRGAHGACFTNDYRGQPRRVATQYSTLPTTRWPTRKNIIPSAF